MGCTSSKRVEASIAADVYRPASTSFSLFDITAIEEPWLLATAQQQQHQQEKSSHVPTSILERLDKFELASDAPHSWSEVSKVLEDLKPTFLNQKFPPPAKSNPPPAHDSPTTVQKAPKKIQSFHTLEELDANQKPPPELPPAQDSPTAIQKPTTKKIQSFHTVEELDAKLSTKERPPATVPPPDTDSFKPVKENSFIVRDRLERQWKVERAAPDTGSRNRRDPFLAFPEKCPPDGGNSVVLYTTSLRGVRRTFEDCQKARAVMEGLRVAVDERDVSLHGEFLNELKEMVGEGATVPRLFVKGRYLGGVEEMVELNETGRLGELLDWVGVGRALGKRACGGCGGARFVPCLECNGSCKLFGGEGKETVRCPKCNENGLVLCPLCNC